ncbi:MAG: DUF2155 domain-containing protein [Methyloceanibacter sp.]
MRPNTEAGSRRRSLARLSLPLALLSALAASPAWAEKIENPIAVFAALDKVTGRILPLEIPINETQQFGALKVTPRVCYTRPPTEAPHTSSFVEVDEVKLTGDVERIFTGWMFADSPGLHAVEHPVFDVWLTSCKTNAPVAPAGSEENAAAPAAEAPAAEAPAAEAPALEAPAIEAPAAEAPIEVAPAPEPEPAPAPPPVQRRPPPRPSPPPSPFGFPGQ